MASSPTVLDFVDRGCSDGMWYWDLEDPEQEWMSGRFWEVFGIDPATKHHTPSEWQSLIHPDDLEVAKANLERHLADPEHPYDQIVRYAHADGSTVWIRCRGMCVRDDDGKPARLLGVHSDLTAAMQTAADKARLEAVASSEVFFKALIEIVDAGIAACDADNVYTVFNATARDIFGMSPVGQPLGNLPAPVAFCDPQTGEEQPVDRLPLKRALAGDRVRDEEWLLRNANGDEKLLRVNARAIPTDDGVGAGAVAAFRDITDARHAEELQTRAQRLDALGQLTGGVAHDFNNILGTIMASLELLQYRYANDKDATGLLDTALQATRHGADLTAQLLTFARHAPRRSAAHHIGALCEGASRLATATIEASIDFELDIQTPQLSVCCDRTEFETTILNLILNARDAVRARKAPKIKVSQRCYEELEGRTFIEVAITDNGIGMAPEVRARAVEPFFTTKLDQGGTGLGLSAAYGFVQQNGGDLYLYSEEGRGTTVRLRLPMADAAGDPADVVEKEHHASRHNLRVLLVDDDASLLQAQTALLQELGCDVLPAVDGDAARALLEANTDIDVLFTDIVMPGGCNGVDLAQQARQLRPDLHVILTSGYAGEVLVDVEATDARFLQKPCSLGEVRRALAEISGGQDAR